ncbi:hypothetical protein AB3662_28935 [Sorangium cellulosum]|uniref:hypothetical protein n=1 Tax=Sorangium cellulosum TaxID=56 RepID=UPI003D9A3A51
MVLADRERAIVSVELDAERGEADAYLREDGDDLAMQINAAAHVARIARMKADGWNVEDEAALRAWLMYRIDRPSRQPT